MGERTCSVGGCGRLHYGLGLCKMHYSRHRMALGLDLPRRDTPCSVQGCKRWAEKRGWCGTHYQRWRRTGSLNRLSDHDRFWSKVDRDGPVPEYAPELGPCWIWTASTFTGGYGQFWCNGKNRRAYGWAWERDHGTIPDGLTLDHLCRVPRCVRPSHLEAVTIQVNLARGFGICTNNARKAHCVHGHEFTEANTIRWGPNGRWRRCRICTQ